jgi:hypothetical protein
MRTDTARTLTTGSAIFYRNLTNLQRFKATVTSATPHQLQISVTTPGTSITFPLDSNDNAAEIPVDVLN